jgi:pyruvate dehydrogenase E1 component beta subunit
MNAPVNTADLETADLETVEMSYAAAIKDAMDIALGSDERVILMGEDIGVYGGAFQVTGDLVHKYGEDRVMDTPISELGGAGVASRCCAHWPPSYF